MSAVFRAATADAAPRSNVSCRMSRYALAVKRKVFRPVLLR